MLDFKEYIHNIRNNTINKIKLYLSDINIKKGLEVGSGEIIRHGVNGLLVDVGDYKGLSNNILKLLNDDILSQKLASRARTTIHDRFTVEKILNNW